MSLKIAVAQSDDVSEEDAVNAVCCSIAEQLGGQAPDAIILLASIDYDHQELLDRISAHCRGVQMVGGTTDGAFASGMGYTEDGVTVLAFKGDGVRFRTGSASGAAQDPEGAARAALEQAGGPQDAKLALFFGDGLGVNTSRVLRALRDSLDGVPLVGGTTGDHWEFKRSATFHGDALMTDGCVLMLVDGDVTISTGVQSGWTPMGDKMTVTSIDGCVLKELDGHPALSVFQDFFGIDAARIFIEYPLAVYEPDGSFYLRAATRVNAETRTVTLAAEIPPGSIVQITNVQTSAILAGARASLAEAMNGKAVVGAFIVSCAARKWMLGEKVSSELQICTEMLGDVPVAGFYSFGEVAPTRTGMPARFHNETFVTLLLHE